MDLKLQTDLKCYIINSNNYIKVSHKIKQLTISNRNHKNSILQKLSTNYNAEKKNCIRNYYKESLFKATSSKTFIKRQSLVISTTLYGSHIN